MAGAPERQGDSRGEILSLLCAADRRVAELAESLGISESAVRVHLRVLGGAGLVAHRRVRGGVGKPAHEYRLTPSGETLVSRAYLPFLRQVLAQVELRMDAREAERLFRAAGAALAPAQRPRGPLRARADAALRLLAAMGGAASIEEEDGALVIAGSCCPLAAVAADHPLACAALESTLSEYVGAPVRAECDRTGRPSCRFALGPGSRSSQRI